MITKHFKVSYLGMSRDYRTNRWRLECNNCKKQFEPETTILAKQTAECLKCQTTEVINYNNYDRKSKT